MAAKSEERATRSLLGMFETTMAKLVIHHPDGQSNEFNIGSLPRVAVGRGDDNTVVLNHPHVSRRHFVIENRGGQYRLVNQSRTHGTFVNGQRTESANLAGGETIVAGAVRMVFLTGDQGDASKLRATVFPGLGTDSGSATTDPGEVERTVLLAADSETNAPNLLASADPAGSTMLQMALRSARDESPSQELVKRFTLLQEIVQEMVTELHLNHLLDYVLARIFELLHADNGAILLIDAEKNQLVPKAVRQRIQGAGERRQLRISRTLIRKVCQERLGYLCADAQCDETLRSQKSIMAFGIRSAMCVPLLFRGQPVGVIHIDTESSERAFTRQDLEFLTMLANQAAICVRNARLHDRIVSAETQRANLGRYFSPQVVERICSNEIKLELGGQSVEVSLLYSDIRGFTPLSERVAPQDLLAFLNDYFSEMAEIVFEFGGTCDKFIGDALLAVFGSPIADAAHRTNAARCAERMLKRLREITFAIGEIQVGIGLHCGRVIHGNIGSERVMQYTVIGDIVNTTARLSNVAKPNQIVMSAAMQAALGSSVKSNPLGQISLKGKSAPVETFELLECL